MVLIPLRFTFSGILIDMILCTWNLKHPHFKWVFQLESSSQSLHGWKMGGNHQTSIHLALGYQRYMILFLRGRGGCFHLLAARAPWPLLLQWVLTPPAANVGRSKWNWAAWPWHSCRCGVMVHIELQKDEGIWWCIHKYDICIYVPKISIPLCKDIDIHTYFLQNYTYDFRHQQCGKDWGMFSVFPCNCN